MQIDLLYFDGCPSWEDALANLKAALAETQQFKALKQAVRIGLLPDILRERIRFIGNSSLADARLALLTQSAWQRAREIAASVTCLELTAEPSYFEEYTAALTLPHTDLSLFPSLT